jgi:hypothetical protein
MSLREIAARDNRAILNADGDKVTIKIDGYPAEVTGQVIRIDAIEDPATGLQVREPKTAVSVNLADLPAGPRPGWRIETTDVTGAALVGTVADVRVDRTIGFANLILEVHEDAD